MGAFVETERPWIVVRIELETPSGEAVSVGPVIVQGMDRGKPLVLQVPIYGQSHLSDGWPSDQMAFGAAVRQARAARGWSQAKLAKRSKLTELTIRSVEQGRTNPSLQTRELLVAAFKDPTASNESERSK